MEDLPPPLRLLTLILTGICLFLAVFAMLIIVFPGVFFNVPAVVEDGQSPADPPVTVSRSFPFQNSTVQLAIAVNASVYTASKKTYRSSFLLGDPRDLGSRYYLAMILDPSQEQIYRDLIGQFRKIRSERNLTGDEYLELITAYVQTLPYKDGGNAPPKYPAELLVENIGDCDDKSILLAGLLSREGYSVALFKFGPESHMAMGIGSDAFPYRSTGYTYLEAMTPAYVGIPSFSLMTRKPLTSEPLVIPVSNGTILYRSGGETGYISAMSVLTGQKAKELSARLGDFPQSDTESPAYLAMLHERDRYAGIHTYIMNHPADRPGTIAWLQREMAGKTG